MGRKQEYEALGLSVRWLSAAKARNANEYADKFSSTERYGLNALTVKNIEHLSIDSYAVADEWLKSRLQANGTLQIVYGKDEVCVIDSAEFLANWQNIFCPSRDDAIVLHNLEPTVLFYCHEQELEIGQRAA